MLIDKRKMILFFVTALIIILFFYMRGDYRIVLDLQKDDSITVSGPQETFFSVRYEDLETIALLDDFDRGECTDGGKKYNHSFGTWNCEIFGEYTLIAMSKVNKHIAITDKDGHTLVFNYESEEVTENLYGLILDLIEQRGNN